MIPRARRKGETRLNVELITITGESDIALRDIVAGWQALYDQAEGALPYLSPGFFRVWTECYQDEYDIVVVVARDGAGDLLAVWPLARQGLEITGIGSYQAEYQGWLCGAESSSEFFSLAVELLSETYPRATVRMKYVLPGHEADALQAFARGRANARLRVHRRPLLAMDIDAIKATLKKKSNRSKLNRLKRLGDLELKRVVDADDFDRYMDRAFAAYDLRQGAQNDTCPFLEDGHKREFHRRWLLEHPDDVAVSLLTLDDVPIAAFFGVRIRGALANAIVAHDPRVSDHSASKLHIYLFAEELAEEGITHLDLTPGGDAWKDRFATEFQEVYELTYWCDPNELSRIERAQRRLDTLKKALGLFGLTPDQLREGVAMARRATPSKLASKVKRSVWDRIEYRIYRFPVAEVAEASPEQVGSINELSHITRYDASVAWSTRMDFLADAAQRLSHGGIVYSVCDEDTLVHYGWLSSERSASFFTEVGSRYEYPEPGAVLYDFFTHPLSRGRKFYQKTLTQMLHDVATRESPPTWVYISVLADNGPSRHVIEKLGFRYIESIVRTTRFTRVTVTGG